VRAFRVAEILDLERAGGMGIEAEALALVISAGAEYLGRLALAGHHDRILAGTTSGDFDAPADLPAAPVDTEEARDLLAAAGASANYAAGRAAVRDGEALVSGQVVAAGTGEMMESAPPFEAPEEGGRWPWEEAGTVARWAILEPLGNF
jgi:RNA-splicing ligase RtcB